MFEKDNAYELYERKDFTYGEKLYNLYINMRKEIKNVENFKYSKEDKYATSEEYKQGFLAGVKIMSSMFFDI